MKKIETQTCRSKYCEEFIRHEYSNIPDEDIKKYHPFDITSCLKKFIFAEGFTYLLSEDKEIDKEEVLKIIPKAYLPYIIVERCFMIYKGNIVWESKKIDKDDNYEIYSLDKVKISDFNYSHKCPSVNDLEKDIENIKKISKKVDNVFMFVKII